MVSITEYQKQLAPLIALASVSTDPAYKPQLLEAADWLCELFTGHGFTAALWPAEQRNPIVYARYEVSSELPTMLVYGHYDVQPAAAEGWTSDPFVLTERAARLYGRGVVDNKGQLFIHIATVLELISSKKLAYNVVFLVEGDEETGATGLEQILREHHDELKCDHIVISDGEIPYRPTLETRLRGGFNCQVSYQTASSDLHSGLYGGGVPNAAQELSKLVASFYNSRQRVRIPGFYDDVDPVTPEQMGAAAKLHIGADRLQQITGIKQELHPFGADFKTMTGYQPTLQVSGIATGYSGPGFANIIPARATVNINIRTVASQQTTAVMQQLETHIREQTPSYVDVEISFTDGNEAITLLPDSRLSAHAQSCLQQAFGEPALPAACGGSLPIVEEFRNVLGIDALLVSLGNDDCNMHGTDENFEMELLKKGLAFSHLFFSTTL